MDRKALLAVMLMMVIAIVPSFFLKKGGQADGRTGGPGADTVQSTISAVPAPQAPGQPAAGGQAGRATDALGLAPAPAPAADDTIAVRAGLATYEFSTRGGRLVQATIEKYRMTIPGRKEEPVTLVKPDTALFGGLLVTGRDTIRLGDVTFTASAPALTIQQPGDALVLTGQAGTRTVQLTYRFEPAEYRFRVEGSVTGVDASGGILFLPLGAGIRNTEGDSATNFQSAAYVTRTLEGATRHDIASLDAGEADTVSGPFDWVAVKSKYFVTAVLAGDSAAGARLSAVQAIANPAPEKVVAARVTVTLPVPASGRFAYEVYAGPMEYGRLARVGREFDDVNPYGWPGFRTLIRFFAQPVRALLVWMHESLTLSYGLVLIAFGILVRVVLWPLNQKAMEASMAMQAIQPELEALKARYGKDPQRFQQEQVKLFKERNVNPFGSCWPMLLPMPILLALFFVLQYSIELRGTSFLWLPDLSLADPFYVVPIVMGGSMWVLYKVGQAGMPPNPQQQMMTWMMPIMMTVMFLNFSSGLNLYYAISNIASIPQQWLIARARMRAGGPVGQRAAGKS
ncbi:MAG: membrane protein insertase YidC [Gemmatimonadales bacterium]|nr:membrane protein insertase YidC [Gemmatimonadales bacterium]